MATGFEELEQTSVARERLGRRRDGRRREKRPVRRVVWSGLAFGVAVVALCAVARPPLQAQTAAAKKPAKAKTAKAAETGEAAPGSKRSAASPSGQRSGQRAAAGQQTKADNGKGNDGKRSDSQPASRPKKPYIVRQGGYVELVDPNVDYKDRLPRIPPRSPQDSLKGMHLIPQVRLELAACEPLVCDPVDLTFDENGYLYVAELTTYSERRDARTGRISRLEDTDGDGRFDRKVVFVDGLEWPTGLLWFDGGLFICSSPDLLYCKDLDGDGRADTREVVLTGFDISNPNQCPNSLRWNLDDKVEGMSGGGGLVEPVRWNRLHPDQEMPPVQTRGRDFVLDPRTGRLELVSGGAQYGMAFDQWGRKYESSNSEPIMQIMFEDRYVARNPFLAAPNCRLHIWTGGLDVFPTSPPEPWRVIRTEMRVRGVFSGPVEGGGKPSGYFTSACGVMVYTGDVLPPEFHGNAFVCEGAGNLVHRMRLVPNGVAMRAERVEQGKEFLTSDENWFRPVQMTVGPDGCLYIADFYREVFEHPDAIPPSVKKYLDLNAGNDRGRIYRIAPPSFQRRRQVRLGDLPTEKLVELLAHPNGWHRDTARRLLYERQDPAAVEPLRRLASDCPSAVGRMQALYALAGQNALTEDVVLARLSDPHPRVREHAVRLSERLVKDSPALRDRLPELANDPDVRVRYQLAFTLGEVHTPRATKALATIARRDVADRWVRLAVLSSCLGRAGDLIAELTADARWAEQSDARVLLTALAEQAGRQNLDDQIALTLETVDRLTQRTPKSLAARALMQGLSKGLAKSNSPWLAKLRGSGTAPGQLLAELVKRALKQAQDESLPVERRVQAVRSLSAATFEQVQPVLASLLDNRQPQQVQIAAVQALSRFDRPEVARLIADAWPGMTPAVRGEAAEALFARADRLAVLLDAVEEGLIVPSQLAPSRIQFLLSHPDAKLRARAEKLLGKARLARREQVVADYMEALKLPADPRRGKEVFKKHCSTCHQLEGVGYDLGLPLLTVKSRGPDGILTQILDPNREVLPRYLDYIVVTTDGRQVTGMITSETATSITLTRAEGQSDTVLRRDIEIIKSTGLSLMPEGLEKDISKQDMADLISYLMSVQ